MDSQPVPGLRKRAGKMKRITPEGFDMPERRSLSQQKKMDRITCQTQELRRVLRGAYRGRKDDQKKGMIILLAGLPGAGKTASAEFIAAETGRPLDRVDLSSVLSKYIGETEKNLKTLFDKAENTDGIILLDEADALFGKRTAVNDAHDRRSNIELTYLLKRIETYPGIVILTTNRIANLDPAFVRRARFTVQFPLPENEGKEESGDR